MVKKKTAFDYSDKKKREKEWYEQKDPKKKSIASRILHSRLFYHPARNSFNYVFPKVQMRAMIKSHLQRPVDRLLIAPCGTGDDLKYIKGLAKQVYGIDLSPIAVKQCGKEMSAKVGDMLKSGYPSNHFDVVVSPLVFHHVLKVGFAPFLKEFRRILKKDGILVILEPSLWYPLNIITRPIKHIFNNPFGEVEDEAPFRPKLMLDALRDAKFKNIEIRAATFSHCSTYMPVAKAINWITKPLLRINPFKYWGWMVLYYAKK